MQKYEAIMADLGVTDLMDFVNRFKAELFVEGLTQGNLTSAVSLIGDLFNFKHVFILCVNCCIISPQTGIQGISTVFYRVS